MNYDRIGLFKGAMCPEKEPRVTQWLRRCATIRTVPGSIPGGVTADFSRGKPLVDCYAGDASCKPGYTAS